MTSKEFVLSKFPKARIETQKGNDGRRYYLIRIPGEYYYIGSGDTPSKSWVNAKKSILANN